MSAIESRSIVPAKPTTQIIANEVPMSTDSNIKNAFEDVNSRNINATCDPGWFSTIITSWIIYYMDRYFLGLRG